MSSDFSLTRLNRRLWSDILRNGLITAVLTILGLARFFVFCVSVKVKLTVPLLCVCVHSAWKGRPRNDLCCVGWDVKPYSLTHFTSLQRPLDIVL